MNLKPFDHYRPRSLAELREIMAGPAAGGFVLLGGGTDVLVKIKQRLMTPAGIISLSGLPELAKLEQQGDDILIGAGVTLRRLEESPLITANFPALARAAAAVGSPQLRNMGTVGGNVRLDTRCVYFNQPEWPGDFVACYKRGGDRCHVVKGGKRCYALFCADTPAALLALEARVLIVGPAGERETPLNEFYRDDGLVCCPIEADELILGLKLAIRPGRESAYFRFSGRGAIDFPLVGVAIAMEKDDRGVVCNWRLAATGMQSRPLRLSRLEAVLAGLSYPRELTQQMIANTLKEIKPVRHHGLSPAYRRHLLAVMVERALDFVRESKEHEKTR